MAEKSEPGEKYKNIDRPISKMLLFNFLGGIAWGLGVLIGTTIIFALIGIFVTKIDFIPIFGEFAARVIKSAQVNLQPQ